MPPRSRRPHHPNGQRGHDIVDLPLNMPQPVSTRIEDGVIEVLKNVSRRPIEPTLENNLIADLGFDSLQVLETIAELEDRFNISIPLEDAAAPRSVADVVARIRALVERPASS